MGGGLLEVDRRLGLIGSEVLDEIGHSGVTVEARHRKLI